MSSNEFRASEHVRIIAQEDEFRLQTREEAGRGKRFGSSGEVSLAPEEAERVAKWILSQSLEA